MSWPSTASNATAPATPATSGWPSHAGIDHGDPHARRPNRRRTPRPVDAPQRLHRGRRGGRADAVERLAPCRRIIGGDRAARGRRRRRGSATRPRRGAARAGWPPPAWPPARRSPDPSVPVDAVRARRQRRTVRAASASARTSSPAVARVVASEVSRLAATSANAGARSASRPVGEASRIDSTPTTAPPGASIGRQSIDVGTKPVRSATSAAKRGIAAHVRHRQALSGGGDVAGDAPGDRQADVDHRRSAGTGRSQPHQFAGRFVDQRDRRGAGPEGDHHGGGGSSMASRPGRGECGVDQVGHVGQLGQQPARRVVVGPIRRGTVHRCICPRRRRPVRRRRCTMGVPAGTQRRVRNRR